jgi:hypothetical protein
MANQGGADCRINWLKENSSMTIGNIIEELDAEIARLEEMKKWLD